MVQCILISGSIPTPSMGVLLSSAMPLGVYGEVCPQGRPIQILVGRPRPDLLQFPASDNKVLTAIPDQRRRKYMSRRSGQNGRIEKKRHTLYARFWLDVPGKANRVYKSVRICPVHGPGTVSYTHLTLPTNREV